MDCLRRLAAEMAAERPAVMATFVEAPPQLPGLVGRKLLVGPDGLLTTGLAANGLRAADSAAGGRGDSNGTSLAIVQEAVAVEAAAALNGGKAGVRAITTPVGAVRIYIEPYLPPPVLLVVGAGHVAQALVTIARLTGFRVVVLDDRPEYAHAGRFPTADQVHCSAFLTGLHRLDPGPRHHVVLVTRGHRHDADCLRELITRPLPYIGMIGSRRRVRAVFEMLAEEGVDPAHFTKVYAPIGLDLGADTPEEIAVAVVAELVRLRRGGTGEHLSWMNRVPIHDVKAGR